LWQSFNSQTLGKISVAATDCIDDRLVRGLIQELDFIRSQLEKLPLVIVNPDITPHTVLHSGDTIQQFHWGRWAIDPLGSGWPVQEKMLLRLSEVLQRAQEQNERIALVPKERVELAALCSALERECRRQMYTNALNLLPALLERVELLHLDDGQEVSRVPAEPLSGLRSA
jgi:hypothetical protein